MKTQCPNCRAILKAPDDYAGRQIKCTNCKKEFPAVEYRRPPIVVPTDALPAAGNFLIKAWEKCPAAFKNGFLATLGVVTALWLCLHIWWLRPDFRPQPSPPIAQSTSQAVILTDYDFEQTLFVKPGETEPRWSVLWTVWVQNPNPTWTPGFYHLEFRDSSGNLIELITQETTFPSTDYPREANGLYWPHDDITFAAIDLTKSCITISLGKL